MIHHDFTVLYEIAGKLFGQRTITTFHYKWTAADAVTELSELQAEDLISAQLIALYRSVTTTDWQANYTRVFCVNPTSLYTSYVKPLSGTGTVEPPTLPPANAAVITRRAFFRGPAGRGRVYLPAVASEYSEEGLVTAAGITLYTTLAEAMIEVIEVGDPLGELTPVLWNTSTYVASTVDAFTVQPVLRVQRRREIGVGI